MFRRRSNSEAISSKSSKAGGKAIIPRSLSVPNRKRRSILRYISAEDSMHKKYGQREGIKKERIKFKNIEIREYARTIGDNPSCSSGPPISIGWEYLPAKVLPLDVYEDTRPPRRSNIEMILPRDLRQRMLRKEWEVTQSQIASAVRTNIKVKNQRRTTVQNLGKSTKMEEAMESASKGFAGLLGRSTDKKMKKLEKQMEKAEKARKQQIMEQSMGGEEQPEDTVPIDAEENDEEAENRDVTNSNRGAIVATEEDDDETADA